MTVCLTDFDSNLRYHTATNDQTPLHVPPQIAGGGVQGRVLMTTIHKQYLQHNIHSLEDGWNVDEEVE